MRLVLIFLCELDGLLCENLNRTTYHKGACLLFLLDGLLYENLNRTTYHKGACLLFLLDGLLCGNLDHTTYQIFKQAYFHLFSHSSTNKKELQLFF